MKFDIITTVFLKELKELLRDRRSLLVMFGIPLVLYPALIMAMGGLAKGKAIKQRDTAVTVAPIGIEFAPRLAELMQQREATIQRVMPDSSDTEDARPAVTLRLPGSFEERFIQGEKLTIEVYYDSSRSDAAIARQRIDSLLDDYEHELIKARLRETGQDPAILEGFATELKDASTATQRTGKLLAGALPALLLITGALGAFFPALNSTTTERELGTLETLLVSPASRGELLTGKLLLVLLCGILTAGLNMASMSLVMWRLTADIGTAAGTSGMIQIRPELVVAAFLTAIPTLVMFSAMMLLVGMIARTFREANSYTLPVMLLPMGSIAVGIIEPTTTAGLLVTPVLGATVVMRDVLMGVGRLDHAVLSGGASLVLAVIVLIASSRLFSNEQLVNPQWEPLSLRGIGKKKPGDGLRRRLPAVDEVLALFSVVLLLQFYLAPLLKDALVGPNGVRLYELLTAQLVGLILLPAVVWALLTKLDWVPTFSLRLPKPPAWLGGLLLGVGLAAAGLFIVVLQQTLFGRTESEYAKNLSPLLEPYMRDLPTAVLTALIIGTLAGTCEELLFRGIILKGLRHGLPTWAAIAGSAFLFALAHFDLAGFGVRFGLGVVCGLVVLRSGSVWPAVLLHGVYNMTVLLLPRILFDAAALQADTGQPELTPQLWLSLLLGAAVATTGWLLVQRTTRTNNR
jgi:sodium transport system permease protein